MVSERLPEADFEVSRRIVLDKRDRPKKRRGGTGVRATLERGVELIERRQLELEPMALLVVEDSGDVGIYSRHRWGANVAAV